MAGPNVQAPSPFSKMMDAGGNVAFEWQSMFSMLQAIAYNGTRSGTTANRPTSSVAVRWVGMPYYDTTLGIPIWLESVSPADVWVDATGTPV